MEAHEHDGSPYPGDSAWAAVVFDEVAWLGSAVLLDDRRLLTSARVARTGPLWVEFPKAEDDDDRRYRVADVVRSDGRYELALLVLEEPAAVAPAPLRTHSPASLVAGRWWAFGFPAASPRGNDARGRIGIDLGHGFVRLDADRSSPYRLEDGFRGAGVWSPEAGAVIAVVVGANEHGDGEAVTLHRADRCFPDQKLHLLTEWTVGDADEVALSSWGLKRERDAPAAGWSLEGDPETARHWSPRARGVTVDSERGYRFQGRTRALTELVAWLDGDAPDRRALVVTGSPGVGKSAVLGRIVTTADRALRARLPEDGAVRATPGSVHCAVHAKGKSALEVAREIARAASARPPARVDDLAPDVAEALTERPRRFNVIVDALDEATTAAEARRIVSGIALPLAQTCPGVRVVVGTRRHDDTGSLLRAFGPAAALLDLDRPEMFALDDLAAYALTTLQLRGSERSGNPYEDDAVAGPVAARIAALSDRNFLVAGLVARSHGLYDDRAVDPAELSFVGKVDDALRAFLERVPPVRGVPASDLLTALAFAEAPGFSPDLWRTAVHALYGTDLPARDLNGFARSSAANFLVESGGEDGEPLYRLFHQALNDVLLAARTERAQPRVDQWCLTRAFLDFGAARSWRGVPGYLLRSLPVHAAAGDAMDDVLADGLYIAHADLTRLLAASRRATSPTARARARLLRLTPQALKAGPGERAAMLTVTEAMEARSDAGLRDLEPPGAALPYRAAWAVTSGRSEIGVLRGHDGGVNAVCPVPWPDGTVLLATAGDDGTVRVWDPDTGATHRVLTGHTGPVYAVSAVLWPDETVLLATAGDDATVRISDPDTGATHHILRGHIGPVYALCAPPASDGPPSLVSAGHDGTVRVWDPGTGALERTLMAHAGPVRAVCPMPWAGTALLATAGDDSSVRIWDPYTGVRHHELAGVMRGAVRALCPLALRDGVGRLAMADDTGAVRLWDPTTGMFPYARTGSTRSLNGLCQFAGSFGGTRLAVAGDDPAVLLWDSSTDSTPQTLSGHNERVNQVCALHQPDGSAFLVTASADATVRIWAPHGETRVPPTPEPVPESVHHNWLRSACPLPRRDGDALLATASDDGTVRIWDPRQGTVQRILTGHWSEVRAVCPLPTPSGDALLASGGTDTKIRIWSPGEEAPRVLTGHEGWVNAVCALPGPPLRLASAGTDATVRIWDPDSGIRTVLRGHGGWVNALCALPHPDGQSLLASAGDDRTIRIWDLSTGEHRVLRGHDGWVSTLCALPTPTGAPLLATAGDDATVRIWDPLTGAERCTLTGHTGEIKSICTVPRPDGPTYLASAGTDEAVRIWDPERSKLVMTIPVHSRALALTHVDDHLIIGLTEGVLALTIP
ncbi:MULTISPECIES: AAA family ATPase [Actinomadura]|uniref:AAA family ATPase n=1 Tax=Actinomadura yumaensis TaxID=111807 RepID=A0ABW2CB62_9ACTN|nr:AAA family ATPase [Actinomadura sp. J1-007]MWK33831.1 hypothetical protein [Actinomadura sp. J1-007]